MKNWFLRKGVPVALAAGLLAGLPATLPGVTGGYCLAAGGETAGKSPQWDFSNGPAGWKYGGQWAYSGKAVVAYDKSFGGGLRIDVDFSQQKNNSWSEIKLEEGTAAVQPIDLSGCNRLTFDLYYNPHGLHTGGFKTKLYAKSAADQEVINVCQDIDLSKAENAANGMKVIRVTIPFSSGAAKAEYFCLSLVGSNTDYKGALYVHRLRADWEKVSDGYVDKTAVPEKKGKLSITSLSVPKEVQLADGQAMESAVRLYGLLTGIARSDYVLYGHQNEMHKKVSPLGGGSDTYDMVKDYAAVAGVDGLALTGAELGLTDAERAAGLTLEGKLAGLSIAASRKGAVMTMSCHMPNFAEVAKRPKIAGKYDYSGYSPNVTSGDVVKRILPGGDLQEIYNGYLDMIAAYALKLQAADVPLILRPFHENNGSWFWWGAAYCTPSQYKNLFRYTEEYLRDVKGVHNLVYAYSPGGPFMDEADYLSRYPGDAYIDILGFDMYHRDPAKGDDWMAAFGSTMDLLEETARRHNKLAAVTETGILVGKSAMAKTGNQRKDWFCEALGQIAPRRMAYFMTWSNFDESNFDQPYMVSEKRGQEMVNNFIDFYNQPQAVFAGQMPDYRKLPVRKMTAAQAAGYILSPDSFTHVCSPIHLLAKVTETAGQPQFLLKKRDGTVLAAIKGQMERAQYCGGELTAEALQAAGRTIGSIDFQLAGKTVDTLPVLFNIPAAPAEPSLIDDFENYYGDNGLLRAAYSTNCGAGCEVLPSLSGAAGQKAAGENGLDFHYHINKGGYAGIVKSLHGVNWSDYKAVQFWLQPDGRGQKLILQLNSNGEDFEVDLTPMAAQKKNQLLRIPFAAFKGKNGGIFDASRVQHFAVYCNTIGAQSLVSDMYFDDIRVVK